MQQNISLIVIRNNYADEILKLLISKLNYYENSKYMQKISRLLNSHMSSVTKDKTLVLDELIMQANANQYKPI